MVPNRYRVSWLPSWVYARAVQCFGHQLEPLSLGGLIVRNVTLDARFDAVIAVRL
jgi:hypothetical protein